MNPASETELRALVRGLLRELLPAPDNAVGSPARTLAPQQRRVSIRDDSDLNAFVRQLLGMLDDPVTGPQVRGGQLRFALAPGPHITAPATSSAPQPDPTPKPVIEIERGAVTEKVVAKAAAEGARIVLGRRAVMTPLAREHARKSEVEVERKPC